MTPEQKLKHAILLRANELDCIHLGPDEITDETVDELYEAHNINWDLQDAVGEVRCSGEDTGLKCELSRHYESKAVAAKMPDGSWVGWTYWYGGGKHGEPETVEWMEDAYDLTVTEEQKVMTVRTFKREET